MSWFLFLDESGQNSTSSPCEVLAGLAIEDRELWKLILRIQEAEKSFFGQRISDKTLELKGKKLLKNKVFRLAQQLPDIPENERTVLAQQCLKKGKVPNGPSPTRGELTALAQAKLAFVRHLLILCGQHQAKAFASIVKNNAHRSETGQYHLRKDYIYLFERYYALLEHHDDYGLIVFDELEKSQCHTLIDQMGRYFRQTEKGQMRAGKIIPEPFFVHSDLTTAIQLADLIAYIVNWGVRFAPMTEPARADLASFARSVEDLRFLTTTEGEDGEQYPLFGFKYINDLRSVEDRVMAYHDGK